MSLDPNSDPVLLIDLPKFWVELRDVHRVSSTTPEHTARRLADRALRYCSYAGSIHFCEAQRIVVKVVMPAGSTYDHSADEVIDDWAQALGRVVRNLRAAPRAAQRARCAFTLLSFTDASGRAIQGPEMHFPAVDDESHALRRIERLMQRAVFPPSEEDFTGGAVHVEPPVVGEADLLLSYTLTTWYRLSGPFADRRCVLGAPNHEVGELRKVELAVSGLQLWERGQRREILRRRWEALNAALAARSARRRASTTG